MIEGARGLAERLRALAKGHEALDVAQFQFIGLDEIKRAYGVHWPAQHEKIRAIAQSFSRKRIDPTDILVSGEDGFVVISGTRTGPDAEIAALAVAHDLNNFFLGELEEQPKPSMSVTSGAVPVAAIAGTFGERRWGATMSLPSMLRRANVLPATSSN